MILSRRDFGRGALAVTLAAPLGARLSAQEPDETAAALAAIAVYAVEHRRYFGLPSLIAGFTTPSNPGTTIELGFADAEHRHPVDRDTLFQIGSISKVMTALLIHQSAAEGGLRLTDPVDSVLREIPLPRGSGITLQHLIDHTSGLADSPPLFAQGGLWTGFKPGERWSYSNTGYNILGKVAERVSGKSLDRLVQERVFDPLGMKRSRGAITGADRTRYAQGYEAADWTIPYARGVPLAPAGWVDVTVGDGNVASTAEDMNRFMRALAGMAHGRGGLGLTPAQASEFTRHSVRTDTPGMSYGNGLMHVVSGGRRYLHHTGGMVGFTSSFHLDPATGVGAFASSSLTAFSSYRPRLLTRYAVDLLVDRAAGRAAPAPPRIEEPLVRAAAYAGRYSGPAGSFEVRAGPQLIIIADGSPAPLQHWEGDLFRTTHPRFRAFTLSFERSGGRIAGASWGKESYAKAGLPPVQSRSDPALARLAGRYVNDSPWWGVMTVVERGGKLWIDTATPLVPIRDNLWRVGEQSWSPERAAFADFVAGRPQTFLYSGEPFRRQDI
jgi:CubicO group peptidase (beta-lactamase class C family)